jgi:hypothetical protein
MWWHATGIHPRTWWKRWMPGMFKVTVIMSMQFKMCSYSQAPTLVGGSDAGSYIKLYYYDDDDDNGSGMFDD